MKYVVQVKYTNPAHEHVSLRRRVETVNRLVEAYDEQEAINRVVRQQRSLGFKIQEAIVHKEPDHVDMTPEHKDKDKKKGVVGDDTEDTMVKKEPVKEDRPMSAPAYSSVGAKILTGKVGTNFGYAANKMPPHLKAAQAASDKLSKVVKRPQAGTLAAARGMKEEAVKEPPKSLTPTPPQNPNQKTTLSPDNPNVQKDDKLKEAAETPMGKKKTKAAEKMIKAAKGKVNKVDFEPTAEITPTNSHMLSMQGKY